MGERREDGEGKEGKKGEEGEGETDDVRKIHETENAPDGLKRVEGSKGEEKGKDVVLGRLR